MIHPTLPHMLIRPHDAVDDETQWRDFVTSQGFGHLCVNGATTPVVVPTQFVLANDEVLLHLAKPNPIFGALETTRHAVLSVAGDWAYIPGAWKAIGDEDPARGIPTTYYAAVQLIGEITIVDEADGIADILRSQLSDVEPDGGLDDPSVHANSLRVIRGLRLRINDVRAKFKYGGNADDAHRQAIGERLLTRDGPGDQVAASRVRGFAPPQP